MLIPSVWIQVYLCHLISNHTITDITSYPEMQFWWLRTRYSSQMLSTEVDHAMKSQAPISKAWIELQKIRHSTGLQMLETTVNTIWQTVMKATCGCTSVEQIRLICWLIQITTEDVAHLQSPTHRTERSIRRRQGIGEVIFTLLNKMTRTALY